MGTATYFSPEQAEGAAVDGRSDVYSLGVVLFEMLAGRPPFVGDTPVEVSSQHVHNAVPALKQFTDAVPRDLEAIVMEAMAKSPSQRYQSADELRADLIRFSEGQPVRAAQRDAAFFGEDATRTVSTVASGEHTQAVPRMRGPRTDIRRRRRGYVGPIVALVVLLIAGAGFAYYLHGKATMTNLPDVSGLTISAATQQLKSDGFLWTTSYVHSSKPKNTVISSEPTAGTSLAKGRSVLLTVSLGKTTSPVMVPDVVGLSLSNAESMLQSLKLSFTVIDAPTAPGNPIPDTVLSQTPLPGTKDRTGDKVTLTVLAPGSKYPMPSVGGETQAGAASNLTTAGLSVSPTVSRTCSNTVASGLVVSTVPVAGSLVASGDGVKLVISSGFCKVVVPTVINDTQSVATSALQTQGLVPFYTIDTTNICTPGTPAIVTSQSAQGGTLVTYGSTVDLTLCDSTGNIGPPTTSPG
jgi:serine/threonine-protein kinase